MKTIKGRAIFLAQFAGDGPPFNSLDAIAGWAAGLGFKGVQIGTWDARLFDLTRRANSKAYCEDIQQARPYVDQAFDSPGRPAGRGSSCL